MTSLRTCEHRSLGEWFPAIIVAGILIALSACTPPPDELGSDLGETRQGEDAFPNTITGKAVRMHIDTIVAVGEGAEADYQRSLAELRQMPGAADVAFVAYQATDETLYLQRQLLLATLADLEVPDALAHLDSIVAQLIPPERFTAEDAEYSTYVEELMIRSLAMEGIARQARPGNEADELIEKYIAHPELTLRQIAIRGYLSVATSGFERDRRTERVRKILPREEHWLLTAEQTDPRTVLHPEMPERFDLPAISSDGGQPQIED